MNQLIFHIGLPKTGTTSIQSTLFWNPPQTPFRFISLDSTFGNQLILAAFSSQTNRTNGYFLGIMSERQKQTMKEFSLNYLRKCLQDCASQNLTPILSAETASSLTVEGLKNFRQFTEQFGFEVRVIGYVRPLLDLAESVYQQFVKIGHTNCMQNALKSALISLRAAPQLDEVFGRKNVCLHFFDRNQFPERCVVKHFLREVGLDSQDIQVVHENESINLNALRFLYAWNLGKESSMYSLSSRFRRRMLMEAMKDLPGPALRFGRGIADQIESQASVYASAFFERFGQPIPMTLSTRPESHLINEDVDMLDFSAESLDWLADTFWARSPTRDSTPRSDDKRFEWVKKYLNRLSIQPRGLASCVDELKLRRHRKKLLQRWMGKTL
jgi:hypothetical protein